MHLDPLTALIGLTLLVTFGLCMVGMAYALLNS